jgi:hypothetical protein
MKLSRWGWRVLPSWTFLLGMLVGGLEGGLFEPRNWVPIGIYLSTLFVLVPLELVVGRRLDRPSGTDRL